MLTYLSNGRTPVRKEGCSGCLLASITTLDNLFKKKTGGSTNSPSVQFHVLLITPLLLGAGLYQKSCREAVVWFVHTHRHTQARAHTHTHTRLR